jgi:hypothetical protein
MVNWCLWQDSNLHTRAYLARALGRYKLPSLPLSYRGVKYNMEKEHWQLLYKLPNGDQPYKSTSSFCLPADFAEDPMLTAKVSEYASDKLLEPKPIAEFKPHVWRQIRKK